MSTFRSDVRDGLYAYLVAFKAANPSLLPGEVYKVRPGSLAPPCAYVGSMSEPRINQDASIRQRIMRPTVVLVQRQIVANETGEAMDDLVDAYLDYLDGGGREHLAGGIIATVSTQDTELDFGGTIYAATVVTHQAEIQEGRS